MKSTLTEKKINITLEPSLKDLAPVYMVWLCGFKINLTNTLGKIMMLFAFWDIKRD